MDLEFRREPIALRPAVLLVLLHSAALSVALQAVVLRADRSDADALRLGKRYPAAGQVLPDGGCVLIAPTWVLTAAHVAAGVGRGGTVRLGDTEVAIERVVLHPDAAVRPGVPPEVDLALIELASPVTAVAPLEIYLGDDELGKTLTIVGYGDHGLAAGALSRGDGRRRAVTNVVDDAGPRRLFMRFDPPPAGTDLEGVGGAGDSGGPALLLAGGRTFVAGISSASMDGQPGHYGVTDVYSRVSAYRVWIMQVIAGTAKPASRGN